MTSIQTTTAWGGVSQAFGWQISGTSAEPVWRQARGETGYERLLAIYPTEDTAIVALGNKKGWPRFQLVQQIKKLSTDSAVCGNRTVTTTLMGYRSRRTEWFSPPSAQVS